MDAARTLRDLDLSDLSDDILALLAKLDLSEIPDPHLRLLLDRYCRVPARAALILRYDAPLRRVVRRCARAVGLPQAELPDEEQNVVLGIHEAIDRYDPERCGQHRAGSFRRFLYRVVHDLFYDHYRHWRREQAHYDRSVSVRDFDSGAHANSAGSAAPACLLCSNRDDPVVVVEWREQLALLDRLLEQHGETERYLLEQLARDISLRTIAQARNLSYAPAKRLKNQLFREVRSQWKRLWG